jgi:glycosyltransferase involved in cell wall biosynthesis
MRPPDPYARPILLLANSLSGGGAEAIAHLMLSRLKNVHCVLFENDAQITVPDKSIVTAYRKYEGGFFRNFLVTFIRVVVIQWQKIRHRPRITISHLEGPNFANVLTLFGGRTTVFVHNRPSQTYLAPGVRNRIMRFLCTVLYRRADQVIAVSQGIKKEFVADFNIDSSKVLVLPNPIDIAEIRRQSQASFGDYRDELCQASYFVSVASLTEQKNHMAMLQIFSRWRAKSADGSRVKLVLLGDGPLHGKLCDECSRLKLDFFDTSTSFDATKDVFFLGFQTNPYPFLRNARAFILTSHWEGLPIALLESMALGVPGLVSDCSEGIHDLWGLSPEGNISGKQLASETEKYGRLLPIPYSTGENLEAWIDAMRQLFIDSEDREEVVLNCKSRARDYDISGVQKFWERDFLDVEI